MVNIYQYIKLNTFAKEGAMHTEVHNAVTAADQGTQYDGRKAYWHRYW